MLNLETSVEYIHTRPLTHSLLLVLYKNATLSNHSFFMFCLGNIISIEMLIFANCVEKINGGDGTPWILFICVLPLSQFLGESCFKAPKVPLNKYFYHWNVHFCYVCTKNELLAMAVSKAGRRTHYILFICAVIKAGISGNLI